MGVHAGLYSIRHVVIQIVPPELLRKVCDVRIAIDQQTFQAGHVGEILQMFGSQSVTEGGVVRPSSKNPGSGCDLEVWFGLLDCPGHGQSGQRLFGAHEIHLIYD